MARKASSGQGAGSAGLVYPALSLAASLRAGGEEDRRELTGLFLSALSAAPSSAIPPPSQVRMARPFLASVPQSVFDGELAPALGLKLRAHPDKFLPVIEVVLSSIARGKEGVDASSQLTEGAGLLPSITKHLRSGRTETRGCAWRSLVLLARLSGRDSLSSAETVAEAVCAMLSAAGPGDLAPGKQRAAGYAALGGVAEAVLVGRDNGAGGGAAAGDLADRTLQTLAACLPRDRERPGAAGVDRPGPGVREAGIVALLSRMRLAWRSRIVAAGTGDCVGTMQLWPGSPSPPSPDARRP